jgi:hypothetical protein
MAEEPGHPRFAAASGIYNLLDVITNPARPDRAFLKQWAGDYDPEMWIRFRSNTPSAAWKTAPPENASSKRKHSSATGRYKATALRVNRLTRTGSQADPANPRLCRVDCIAVEHYPDPPSEEIQHRA